MSSVVFRFPLRTEGGEKWCSLASMGIKRLDLVAFKFDVKQKHSFAGGHRHRYAVVRDDIHLLLPLEHELEWDISRIEKAAPPRRRHDRR